MVNVISQCIDSNNEENGDFKTAFLLPEGIERQGEGGLRTNGHVKKSYEGKPLISIITVVFNGSAYLEETIQSVINQSYDNVEYIIIDGGSTDGTLDIIKKYEDKIDYWVSENDDGMYDAIAKGFSLCKGEVVAYINSDDFYLPNAFATVVSIFNQYDDIYWLTGMPVIYNRYGQITSVNLPFGYSQKDINQGVYSGGGLGFIQQESTFWRKKMLDCIDFNKFRAFKLAGDYYLWNKFSENENLYLVQSCLSGFRVHPNQQSIAILNYTEEIKKINKTLPMKWSPKVIVLKLLGLLPIKIKQKYSPNLVYYQNSEELWVKTN